MGALVGVAEGMVFARKFPNAALAAPCPGTSDYRLPQRVERFEARHVRTTLSGVPQY